MFKITNINKSFVMVAGMISGVLITLFVQFLCDYSKLSYSVAKAAEKNWGGKVTDLSTEKLFIHDINGAFLNVLPIMFPKMLAFFDLEGGGFHSIKIIDSQQNTFCFYDDDLDGNWDFRDFASGEDLYLYARNSGFPDVVIGVTGTTVRIDGDYYSVLHEEGRSFIMQSGEKLEIFPQAGGFFSAKGADL